MNWHLSDGWNVTDCYDMENYIATSEWAHLERDWPELNERYNQAQDFKINAQFDKAISALEELIERTTVYPCEDEVYIYCPFHSMMEWELYQMYVDQKKRHRTVCHVALPIDEYHLQLAEILNMKGKTDLAREHLDIALQWNPVNFDTYIEYGMLNLHLGDKAAFLWQLRIAHRYAYTPEQFARLLTCWGAYYVEIEEYEAWRACQTLSSRWDPFSAVSLATRKSGVSDKMTNARIMDLSERFGYPTAPDQAIVERAIGRGQVCIYDKNWSQARYFLELAYDLTQDDNIWPYLNMIPTEEGSKK